jgi:hypothetical protein
MCLTIDKVPYFMYFYSVIIKFPLMERRFISQAKLIFGLVLCIVFSNSKAQVIDLDSVLLSQGVSKNSTKWNVIANKPNADINAVEAAFDHYWDGKTPEKGQGYKAFKRWLYNKQSQVDATGVLQNYSTITKTEYEKFENLYGESTTKSNTGDWINLKTQQPTGSANQQYPGNGRCTFITFHPTNPSIIFTGSPSGGLWKTVNDGLSWTPMTDDYANLGASSLAINYNNPNIMYLATGDGDAGDTYSVGILKTTDGGATWSTTGFTYNTSQTVRIFKILMDPNDPNKMFAACTNGLFLTTDGWATNTTIFSGTIWDVEFKPGNSQYVYMTAWGGAFYRSTTGGGAGTWSDQSSGLPASSTSGTYRQSIAVSAANPAKVWFVGANYSDDGFYGFYTNTNSGAGGSWGGSSYVYSTKNLLGWYSDGSGAGGQGWYDLTIAVSPTDELCIYIGGVNLWKTTTGGNGVASWNCATYWDGSVALPNVHADHHGTEFYPGSGTVIYDAHDGGVSKTANNGTSWSDISSNLTIAQIYGIGGTQHVVMSGWQDDGVNKWDDKTGTSIWTHVRGGDGIDCMTDYTNDDIVYGSYPQGLFYRSTTGGVSWTGISPPPANQTAAWFTPICMHPTTNTTLYSATSAFYKSTTSGSSWGGAVTLPGLSFFCTDMNIAKGNPNYIYVANPYQIWRSTNGGTSFTNVTTGLPVASATITYIGVSTSASNPTRIWVTLGGFSAGNKVFYSADGGTNWTNISYNLPNIPFNTVAFDPFAANDLVYIGGDAGVYYKDNTMSEWKLFNNGLPNVKIMELEIYNSGSQSASKLRAATYGRGLWESDLYQATNLDAECFDVLIPDGGYCGVQSVTPTVTIKNKGTTTLTTLTVSYNIDGGSTINTNWTGSLGTDGTADVNFSSIALTAGPHSFNASVSSPNGGTDANTTNDAYSEAYNVITGTSSLPFTEAFETAVPPAGWAATIVTNSGTIAPTWTQSNTQKHGGTFSARFNSVATTGCEANDRMRLRTSPLSFFGLTNVTLTYWLYHNPAATDEFVQVQYSTDGLTWMNIGPQVKGTAAFVQYTVDLHLLDGQSCVYIGFLAQSYQTNYIYIDDVSITGGAASCTPPATQATNFSATSITNNSMTLNWSRGNGNNLLVVAKKGLTPDTDPASGTSYTANSVFGTGQQLGSGNYVVYNGSGTSVNVTGLLGNETYYFAFYEYNTTGTCYNTIEMTGNATTLGSPSVITTLPTNITSSSFTSGGTVSNLNGSSLTAKGICYGYSANPTVNDFITNDIGQGTTVGSYTSNVSGGLQGSMTYHLRAYASNAFGTSYGQDLIFSTLCGSYTLNLTQGFNSSSAPSCWSVDYYDNTTTAAAPIISFSSGSYAGTQADDGTIIYPQESSYFVKFNSYNCDNGDQARLISPAINTLGKTNIAVNFQWNYFSLAGADSVIVQYKIGAGGSWISDFPGAGKSNRIPRIGTNGWVAKSTTLPAAAQGQSEIYVGFLFKSGYGYNCALDNLTITATNSCTYPTAQATTFSASPINTTSMTINWARGVGGDNVLVLARKGAAVTSNPMDGISYTANPAFGSGQTIGSGNYVVFNGSGTSVNVTNLIPGTTYYFSIYEYKNTNYCYKSPALTGNATTSCALSTFPFTEGFENGTLPTCWSKSFSSGTNDWQYLVGNGLTNPSITHGGNYNACLKRTSAGTDVTYLITPGLNISSMTTPKVNFWYAQQVSGGNQDELRVYYKTSAGGSWNLIGTYTANNPSWTEVTLALPSPSSDYYIGFQGTAKYGYGVCLDDITVCDYIAISGYTSNTTRCEGENTTYSVTATGTGLLYQWQENTGSGWSNLSNAGKYSNVTTASMTISGITAGMSGYQYQCVISGTCSPSVTSPPASLTVNLLPSISSHPSDAGICSGANTSFSVTASGAAITYQWQVNTGSGFNNIIATGSNPTYANWTTATLNVNSVVIGNNGYLYRSVVSGFCTPPATSNSATLTVEQTPAAPTSAISDRDNFCADDAGTINLSVTGGNGTSVGWYTTSCGTGSIGTGNPLNIPSPATTTTYYARWETASCGSTTCQSTTVTVIPLPSAPTSAQSDRNNFCADDAGNISLSVTGGSGSQVGWYTSSCGGTSVGTGNPLVIASPTTSTTYYARWETSGCYSSCQNTTVTVIPLPTAPTSAQSDRNNFCSDDAGNISLSVTGGTGTSVGWYTTSCGGTSVGTGNPLVIASPAATTIYYARWETASCGNSTCQSTTVTVITAPTAPTSAQSDRNNFCSDDAGNISLSVTGGSGSQVGWYTSSCGGTSVGTGNPIVIASPASSTTYYARWESGSCYSTCQSAGVTVLALPTAPTSAQSDRNNFCTDDAGTINLSVTGGSGTSVGWYTTSCGVGFIGTGNPLNIASPAVTTTYYARWETASCGNSTCQSATVTVITAPTAPASAQSSRNNFCADDAGTINLSVTGGSGASVGWYTTSCGVGSIGSGNPLNIASPAVTTTYYARWENGSCYSTCQSVTVTVNALPSATASSNSPVTEGNALNLTGGPGSMTTYAWTGPLAYSDGNQSPQVSASATVAMSGTYTLTVTDGNGCSNSASTLVAVNPAGIMSTAAGGPWATGSTWVGGSVPATSANAIIATTGAGAVDIAANLTQTGSVTILNGATLTTSGGTISFGAFTINSGGTATIRRSFTVTGSTSVTGTLNFSSTNGTARAIAFNGDVTLYIGAIWTEPASGNGANNTYNFAGNLTNDANTFNALGTGIHTFSGGTKILSGATNTSIANVAVTGTYTNNGTLTVGTALTGAGGLTNGATGILNIGGTSTVTTLTASAVGNTVNYTGAAQTGRVITYHNLTLSGSGAKTFATTPTVNGVLSLEGTATVSVTTGVITYGTNATLQYKTTDVRTATLEEWLATFAATGGVIIANTAGSVTMNAAKLYNASVPLTINSGATLITNNLALNFGGDFINNGGTFTAGSSAITIENTMATQSIAGFTTTGAISMTKTAGIATFTGNVNGNTLTINGSGGTLNLGTGRTHTFTGLVTLTAGTLDGGSSTFNANLVAAPAWTNTAGVFTPSSGTVNFGGAGAQSLTGTLATTFNNLTLSNSGIKTLTMLPTVNGILSIEGTTTVSAASAPTYGAASTIQYNGSIAQTTGPELPATFNGSGGLIIANTSGSAVTLSSATVLGGPLAINTSAKFDISKTASLTVGGATSNAGTFTIKADASSVGSFIDNGTITGTGTFNVEKYMTGAGGATPNGRFWYIASPVASATSNVINAAGTDKLWYYTEGSPGSYTEITDNATSLNIAEGYAARLGATSGTYTFTGGAFNKGSINITGLTRTGTTDGQRGFHLIGNPYPSHVSWDLATKTNMGTTIWYRTISTGGSMVFDTYNSTGGIGTNNNGFGTVTGILAPMQAVWVRASTDNVSGSITFDLGMRSHSSSVSMKTENQNNILRLAIDNGTNTDEAVIYFNSSADNNFDPFDSEKMFATDNDVPQIYTTTSDNTSVAINGSAEVAMGSEYVVPLGFSTNIAGTFELQATNLADFDPSLDVYLEDQMLGNMQDLRFDDTYTFTSDIFDDASRFKLHFGGMVTDVPEENTDNTIVYTAFGNIYISTTSENSYVEVYDLLGKKLLQTNIEKGLSKLQYNFTQGVYVIIFNNDQSTITKKILID